MTSGIQSGEAILAVRHPIYKRRYAVSTDLFAGCRIGCKFCYYRFGPLSEHFHPGATLVRLATPEQYAHALQNSMIVRPGDLVIICARSDFSMPENRDAFLTFLGYYDFSKKPLLFLVLQRAPWRSQDWKMLKDAPVIFGTTITPLASVKQFNQVRDNQQIAGLLALRSAGCPAKRISLELGPILPDTVPAAVEIAQTLADNHIVDFLVYRGASVGGYGDFSEEHQRLREQGFWDKAVPYTYWDGKESQPHEYYVLKNYIAPDVEEQFRTAIAGLPIRAYRHTGHLYPSELGVRVAITRNNRVREEMRRYAQRTSYRQVQHTLDATFGIRCAMDEVETGVYLLHRRGTEDIAHAIGVEVGAAILFDDFANQPTPEDLTWYFREGWLTDV